MLIGLCNIVGSPLKTQYHYNVATRLYYDKYSRLHILCVSVTEYTVQLIPSLFSHENVTAILNILNETNKAPYTCSRHRNVMNEERLTSLVVLYGSWILAQVRAPST